MISLRPMADASYVVFTKHSQENYTAELVKAEGISLAQALGNCEKQFERLVPTGMKFTDQEFYDVALSSTAESVGYLWLGFGESYGLKITSINDVMLVQKMRGQGLGKTLMKHIEEKAAEKGSSRIRLHVFNHNISARELYLSMGFKLTSLYMHKDLLDPSVVHQKFEA